MAHFETKTGVVEALEVAAGADEAILRLEGESAPFAFPLRGATPAVTRDWLSHVIAAIETRNELAVEYDVTDGPVRPVRVIEQATDPPATPSNLRVEAVDSDQADLTWDAVEEAQDYEVKWRGRLASWLPWPTDKGRDTFSGTSMRFTRGSSYTDYTFRVRSRGHAGTSDWSGKAEHEFETEDPGGAEDEVTFTIQLAPDIPPAGQVIWSGVVRPTIPARLHSVLVVGNDFTPYFVQFLPPGSDRTACGSDAGVPVEPGARLEGPALDTLYGSATPETPVVLLACKRWRTTPPQDVDPIPVTITYRRD